MCTSWLNKLFAGFLSVWPWNWTGSDSTESDERPGLSLSWSSFTLSFTVSFTYWPLLLATPANRWESRPLARLTQDEIAGSLVNYYLVLLLCCVEPAS